MVYEHDGEKLIGALVDIVTGPRENREWVCTQRLKIKLYCIH